MLRLALLALVPICFAAIPVCYDPITGNTVDEGREIVQAGTWYRCVGGTLNVYGCIHHASGRRARVGETVEEGGYVRTCNNEGYMKPTSCIYKGRTYRVGETIADDYFYYQCSPTETGVVLEPTGCRGLQGERIEPGERVPRGDYMYRCSLVPGRGVTVEAVGCIYDGVEHPVGTSFNGGAFWYTCYKSPDGSIMRKLSGCVSDDGKRMNEGEKYYKNSDFVFQCIRTTGGFEHRVVGCCEVTQTGQITERRVGEQWTEGQPPFQFVVQCKRCSNGSVITKSVNECSYETGNGDRAALKPGCMRHVSNILFRCGTTPGGGLQMFSETYTPTVESRVRQDGYRTC